jgi:hypothetical protein
MPVAFVAKTMHVSSLLLQGVGAPKRTLSKTLLHVHNRCTAGAQLPGSVHVLRLPPRCCMQTCHVQWTFSQALVVLGLSLAYYCAAHLLLLQRSTCGRLASDVLHANMDI